MKLTHFDQAGKARMVDVGAKDDTERRAVAVGRISMKAPTLQLVKQGGMGKGDVLGVAQVAGIMATKKTWELVPMCHPLLLTGIKLSLLPSETENCVDITAEVSTTGKTGVEMEALTAVSVAALTVYDMCKAVDKDMTIEYICLNSKSGGKSGEYTRKER